MFCGVYNRRDKVIQQTGIVRFMVLRLKKLWSIKTDNLHKHKKLKAALMIIFPLLVTFTAEFNHMQSLRELFYHITNNFNVFIFSVLLSAVVFYGIVFITRSSTFAVFITWVALYTFSWVEYYKFLASGTHFVVTDMVMIGNASDMTKFTSINIGMILNLNFFIMLAFTAAVFFLNIKIRFKFVKSFAIGFACLGMFACFIVFPALSFKVYSFFDIDNSESVNSFVDNDKFENLNFIPYFVESATNLFTYAVEEPEKYSEEALKNILKPSDAEIKTKTESEKNSEKINVIYILSESFADFRSFESDNTSLDLIYTNFDIMRNEGFSGDRKSTRLNSSH